MRTYVGCSCSLRAEFISSCSTQLRNDAAHTLVLHLQNLLVGFKHAHGCDQAGHFSHGGSVGVFQKALAQLRSLSGDRLSAWDFGDKAAGADWFELIWLFELKQTQP